MATSLKSKAATGLSWTFLNQFVRQFITIVVGIILSRLLGPSAFGLIAMVTVLTQFAIVFADAGYGSALVQSETLNDSDLSTVFWANLVIGVALSILLAVLSPLIASFYGHTVLKPISLAIAPTFILSSLCVVQRSLLIKELNFKRLFYIATASVGISGTIAIFMALSGWGVWSLVAKVVCASGIQTVLLWGLSNWRPKFRIDVESLKRLSRYGLPLVANNSFNYWTRNIDNLLIGKVWGDVALGLYAKAYALMLLPLANTTRVLSQVMFPAFSKIQNDKQKVAESYLRLVGITSLLSFPIAIGMCLTAEPLILTLYGSKWVGAIEVFRILSLLCFNQPIVSLNGVIFQSQGATMLQFKWGLASKTIIILLIVAGLSHGIKGVATCYVVGSFLMTLPSWWVIGQIIPVTIREILLACRPAFFAALSMGVFVQLSLLAIKNQSMPLRLSFAVALGAAVYLAIVQYWRFPAFMEVSTTARQMWRSRFPRKAPNAT